MTKRSIPLVLLLAATPVLGSAPTTAGYNNTPAIIFSVDPAVSPSSVVYNHIVTFTMKTKDVDAFVNDDDPPVSFPVYNAQYNQVAYDSNHVGNPGTLVLMDDPNPPRNNEK
jgi:hypothetical protein